VLDDVGEVAGLEAGQVLGVLVAGRVVDQLHPHLILGGVELVGELDQRLLGHPGHAVPVDDLDGLTRGDGFEGLERALGQVATATTALRRAGVGIVAAAAATARHRAQQEQDHGHRQARPHSSHRRQPSCRHGGHRTNPL
jgi:hypothetical protein